MREDYLSGENENLNSSDKEIEKALRPLSFSDFTGQYKIVDNIKIFVLAAKRRGEPLDHVLLHGPPGLGKTTLSHIIANELDAAIKITSGPVLDKPSDLACLLTNLEEGDVLFIDEIHRLNAVVEEYLYSAMEDFRIDIMLDSGPNARSVQISLSPFTLIGATTRSGLLTSPLRARFGINARLEYYNAALLTTIVIRSAGIMNTPIDEIAAYEIARRSRGTPRIANMLLRRTRDFAEIKGNGIINLEIAKVALDRKSTRLNSSHVRISYAVFCLKKKKKRTITINLQHGNLYSSPPAFTLCSSRLHKQDFTSLLHPHLTQQMYVP